MRSFVLWLVLIGGAYVLQASLLPLIAYHRITVDLLLLLTLSVGFFRGTRFGAFVGFMAGLLQDLAVGSFFGVNILSKMLIGFCCGTFANRIFKEQFFLPLFASLAATIMNYFIFVAIMLLLGYRFNLLAHLQMTLLPMVVYNVIFAVPVHRIVYMFNEYVREKK